MAVKILTEDEPLTIETLVVLIYGLPGVGKSSLAFQTENPVMLDFDEGVKRAVKRKATASFDTWLDAWDWIHSEDFKTHGCKTLIVDTGGVMLDNYMARHVVFIDDKNGKKGGGVSLAGYGAMKDLFYTFLNMIKKMGIDIVFVCHAASEKEGDVNRFYPKMTGGSYDILLAASDQVGFFETLNNKRTLNFNPTDRNVGKNSAQFPVITVPDYMHPDYDGFLGRMITQAKEKMMEMSESQKNAIEKVEGIKAEIAEANSIEDLEMIATAIEGFNKTFKIQLDKLIGDKYIDLYTIEVIEPVSTPKEANDVLAKINEGKKYLMPLQTALKKKTDTLKFVFDKDSKEFSKAPAGGKTEAPKEKVKPGEQGSLV